MARYEVRVQEVWEQTWVVEAASPEEAVDFALNGEGDEGSLEYSHTLDPDVVNNVKEIK